MKRVPILHERTSTPSVKQHTHLRGIGHVGSLHPLLTLYDTVSTKTIFVVYGGELMSKRVYALLLIAALAMLMIEQSTVIKTVCTLTILISLLGLIRQKKLN